MDFGGLTKHVRDLLMFSKPAIQVKNLSKCYQLYNKPSDRLKQFLWRGKKQFFREFWALNDINFEVMPGEVLGIVGRNGAGKSTLLQLLCGTLNPSFGEVKVNGRVAALLELGSGFNPEFSGRENVFMNGAILGLTQDEISARFDDIVAFSGIGDFIDQPVKTYSSGMFVRLAFSVATSVYPDILIIDEALSVGDGAFSHKSFNRIMQLKEQGTTILFCSHNLFQVDALCNKVLWINNGKNQAFGMANEVLPIYSNSLESSNEQLPENDVSEKTENTVARIEKIAINQTSEQKQFYLESSKDDLRIQVKFQISNTYPPPSIGIGIRSSDGRLVSSAGSLIDNILLSFDKNGIGEAEIIFPKISLLKGEYLLDVYLMCERGIHVYDMARPYATLMMKQQGLEQGLVNLPHRWEITNKKI